MNKIALLRVLLIAQWILAIVGGTIDEIFGQSLMSNEGFELFRKVPSETSLVEPLIGLALMAILVGSIGLFLLKRLWFWIFASGILSTFILSPFMGDFISSGLALSIYSLAGLMTGMVFVIGYDVTKTHKKVD
jgi:hypothetical protein